MQKMKFPGKNGCVLIAVAVASLFWCANCHAEVELKVVKYAGLADVVKKAKGKVVVVDLWAEW